MQFLISDLDWEKAACQVVIMSSCVGLGHTLVIVGNNSVSKHIF